MPSAIEVARRLEAAGRSVTIVSCHTIKPLDVEGITALLRSHRQVVVIEEAAPGGGLGAQVKVLAWDAGDRKSTTSELQSLMRISYAVFCLTKKKTNRTKQ